MKLWICNINNIYVNNSGILSGTMFGEAEDLLFTNNQNKELSYSSIFDLAGDSAVLNFFAGITRNSITYGNGQTMGHYSEGATQRVEIFSSDIGTTKEICLSSYNGVFELYLTLEITEL